MKLMTLKAAREIAGTLGDPSKMPGKSYGIPAASCNVGSILAKLLGTVCYECYALKGNYTFPSVAKSQKKRLASLYHELWVVAMVRLILHEADEDEFRWHDSGDLQSMRHLLNILAVARQTPKIKHWLPTKEAQLMREFAKTYGMDAIPDNMVNRISGTKVNGKATKQWPWTSTVHDPGKEWIGEECRAYTRGGKCGDCRLCWDETVPNISYPIQ